MRINGAPLTATTDLVDTGADLAQANSYTVRPVLRGTELRRERALRAGGERGGPAVPQHPAAAAGGRQCGSARGQSRPRLSLTVRTMPAPPTSTAMANTRSCSSGIRANARDNASAGLSGRQLIDAYKLDGTLLWRIDLGRNIRAGAHYTQFIVADLDGDGRAEVACKTADGTVDGVGTVIGDATKDYRSLLVPTDGITAPATNDRATARCSRARSTSRSSTASPAPRSPPLTTSPAAIPSTGWGGIGGNGNTDSNGNRADRFLAGLAYLDGELPSVIMARGYYGRDGDRRVGLADVARSPRAGCSIRDCPRPPGFLGPAPRHSRARATTSSRWPTWTAMASEEIIYGAMVVDDNGVGLFSTGLRHGDALHVGDLDAVAARASRCIGVHESERQHAVAGHAGHGAVRRADRRRSSGASLPGQRRGPRHGGRHRSAHAGL